MFRRMWPKYIYRKMASLRQIRESLVRPLRTIPEGFNDFELNPGFHIPSDLSNDPHAGLNASDFDRDGNNDPDVAEDYINPDKLFDKSGSTTFIYTTEGKVYYGTAEDTTHYQLIGMNRDLLVGRYKLYKYYRMMGLSINEDSEQYHQIDFNHSPESSMFAMPSSVFAPRLLSPPQSGPVVNSEGNYGEPREIATKIGDLAGRIGDHGTIVSFWNTNKSQYDNLLQSCLSQLISDQKLSQNPKISTPLHGTVPLSEVSNIQMKEMTPEDYEQMELHKQLHLMRGGAKQQAMKKLGVGGGGKPHPVQQAMDNAGLRVPGQKWWAPHSEGLVREWEEKSARRVAWRNPDQIFNDDNITFIYTTDGQLFVSTPGEMLTHYDLIDSTPELKTKFNGRRGGLALGNLLGRISYVEGDEFDDEWGIPSGNIISFWNQKSADYDRFLIPCLEAIKDIGRLAPDAKISTPIHGTVPLSSVIGGQSETTELTPEEQEHWELARNMHLMRGDQKKDAMKKLGVGGGGKPHPMQKAMDDAGLRVPGQKWWAPHSEDFDRKLSMALTCLW